MAKKSGLGRGLDSLFAENVPESEKTVVLRLSEIEPNRAQPREQFDEEALASLADSIAQHGLLQPLVVRPIAGGAYQIVAGERRWRACRMAGLETVPVMIRELDDKETAQLALVENLQREDLNALEEAQGYQALLQQYGLTQEQVARAVGKSRPAITNALRLLGLRQDAREALINGEISAGQARALLAISDPDRQAGALAAAKEGMSVRELEIFAKNDAVPQGKNRKTPLPPFAKEVELALAEQTGRRVRVQMRGKGGTLQIDFSDRNDLTALANQLVKDK